MFKTRSNTAFSDKHGIINKTRNCGINVVTKHRKHLITVGATPLISEVQQMSVFPCFRCFPCLLIIPEPAVTQPFLANSVFLINCQVSRDRTKMPYGGKSAGLWRPRFYPLFLRIDQTRKSAVCPCLTGL